MRNGLDDMVQKLIPGLTAPAPVVRLPSAAPAVRGSPNFSRNLDECSTGPFLRPKYLSTILESRSSARQPRFAQSRGGPRTLSFLRGADNAKVTIPRAMPIARAPDDYTPRLRLRA
jgi:hypothetical protein